MDIYKWYKAERFFYLHHIPLIPMLIKIFIRILFGGVIPYQAEIGEDTIIGYQGLGVVIHKRCIIGKFCHIAQNVTIGGTSNLYQVPELGNHVEVGAGAVVIGPIKIGSNVIIGANAVVNRDIPDNCVAVGVPARVIKHIAPEDFKNAKCKVVAESSQSHECRGNCMEDTTENIAET